MRRGAAAARCGSRSASRLSPCCAICSHGWPSAALWRPPCAGPSLSADNGLSVSTVYSQACSIAGWRHCVAGRIRETPFPSTLTWTSERPAWPTHHVSCNTSCQIPDLPYLTCCHSITSPALSALAAKSAYSSGVMSIKLKLAGFCGSPRNFTS